MATFSMFKAIYKTDFIYRYNTIHTQNGEWMQGMVTKDIFYLKR